MKYSIDNHLKAFLSPEILFLLVGGSSHQPDEPLIVPGSHDALPQNEAIQSPLTKSARDR
jgi:hypothetical protein